MKSKISRSKSEGMRTRTSIREILVLSETKEGAVRAGNGDISLPPQWG